jgi:hypothetical protein
LKILETGSDLGALSLPCEYIVQREEHLICNIFAILRTIRSRRVARASNVRLRRGNEWEWEGEVV